MEYGAEQARLIDCRLQLAHEGIAALQSRRLPSLPADSPVLQHDRHWVVR